MYKVESTPSFDRDFNRLDRTIQQRIQDRIAWIASNPDQIGSPMRYLSDDMKGLRKERVGDYRLFFWIDHQRQAIILYSVEHRSKAYRR